jgi:hypothetical protein
MSSVGTLAWARKTGGRLGFFDRLALTRQAIRVRALRKQQAGMTFAAVIFDASDYVIPDTNAAKRAIAVATALSKPFLLNHCYRSFHFARLLAKANNVPYDLELLFIGTMLHDLGLTDSYSGGQEGEHCFAVTGARRAHEAMEAEGWSTQKLEALEEAIILHLNIQVPLQKLGAEAHLLHAGVMLDMIGARMGEIKGGVEKVVEMRPRLDHKASVPAAVRHQCSIRPDSRAAFLVKKGFGELVQAAPFGS